MLRRKRAAGDWDDLDDSDDDEARRRRMKRRQFAKLQRALFADERISKVAANPRNQAFLRTIEDRDSDEEMDFLFAPTPAPVAGVARLERQDSGMAVDGEDEDDVVPDSQPLPATNQPKPTAVTTTNPRRTKPIAKRPSTLAEIRQTLSSLLEDDQHLRTSSSIIPETELASSSELEDNGDTVSESRPTSSSSSNKENLPSRRTKPGSGSSAIVDRLSLKRQSSSNSSTSRQAFTTTSGSPTRGPKVPTLLRRATTNSLLSNSATNSSSSSTGTTFTGVTTNPNATTSASKLLAAGAGDMKIKKVAGKRSGVSYLARENERRAALAEAERRREERKVVRGMEGRVEVVRGVLGRGSFE